MRAAAKDPNGKIKKVERYNRTALLGTQSLYPFALAWKNVPAGNYTLTAKATDDSGMVTISDIVNVSVVTIHKSPDIILRAFCMAFNLRTT